MSSKGILYVILSGPDQVKRTLEGLRIAEYQAGDGNHGLAIMLQGEGVKWLQEVNEDFRKEIQASIGVIHELGAAVFVCGASLNEYGLTATMGDYKFLTSSAPKRISQVIGKGWQLAIF